MVKVTITLDEDKTRFINPKNGQRYYRYKNNGEDSLSMCHVLSKWVEGTDKAIDFVKENITIHYLIEENINGC